MNEIRVSETLLFTEPNCPTRAGEIVNTLSEIYDIPMPRLGMSVYVNDEKRTYTIIGLKSKTIGGIVVPNAQVSEYEVLNQQESNAVMTELVKRVQGKSENSSASDDPFKRHPTAFTSVADSTFINALNMMHSDGYEGHWRLYVGKLDVEVKNVCLYYENDIWVQTIKLPYKYNGEGFVLDNSGDYRIRTYYRMHKNGVWGEWREVEEELKSAVIAEENRAKGEEAAIRKLIIDLIGESPETLDTIHEISSWILNDKTGAAAMATQINKNTAAIAVEGVRIDNSLAVLVEHDKVVRPLVVLLDGEQGDLSLDLAEEGTTVNVSFTISVKKGGEAVENPIIRIDGAQLLSNTYQGSATVDKTYNVEVSHTYVIAGRETTEVVDAKVYITFVKAMYFGFAGSSITTLNELTKQPLKKSPAGQYTLQSESNGYMWLCVPENMTINKVTMSGFEVPVSKQTTGLEGYNCYRSNELVAGIYNIEIS